MRCCIVKLRHALSTVLRDREVASSLEITGGIRSNREWSLVDTDFRSHAVAIPCTGVLKSRTHSKQASSFLIAGDLGVLGLHILDGVGEVGGFLSFRWGHLHSRSGVDSAPRTFHAMVCASTVTSGCRGRT